MRTRLVKFGTLMVIWQQRPPQINGQIDGLRNRELQARSVGRRPNRILPGALRCWAETQVPTPR
jgi:hypothetical protein